MAKEKPHELTGFVGLDVFRAARAGDLDVAERRLAEYRESR